MTTGSTWRMELVMACSTVGALARLLVLFLPETARVLDATSGSEPLWKGPNAWLVEIVGVDANPCRPRDAVSDFGAISFGDNSRGTACFDPPHLIDSGRASIIRNRATGA